MSELRVIELLDDLCEEMSSYELAPGGEAEGGRPQRWVHSGGWVGGRAGGWVGHGALGAAWQSRQGGLRNP